MIVAVKSIEVDGHRVCAVYTHAAGEQRLAFAAVHDAEVFAAIEKLGEALYDYLVAQRGPVERWAWERIYLSGHRVAGVAVVAGEVGTVTVTVDETQVTGAITVAAERLRAGVTGYVAARTFVQVGDLPPEPPEEPEPAVSVREVVLAGDGTKRSYSLSVAAAWVSFFDDPARGISLNADDRVAQTGPGEFTCTGNLGGGKDGLRLAEQADGTPAAITAASVPAEVTVTIDGVVVPSDQLVGA